MRVLLLLPPMTQLNAPYPATAFLTGFLRSRGVDCVQADLAMELVLRLFSRAGLDRILARLAPTQAPSVAHLRTNAERFRDTIEPTIAFLQGRDPTLALRIASRSHLPEGPRFQLRQHTGADEEELLNWGFGALGLQDKAKYLATLYLEDLADAVRDGIDPHFELARYAEKLAVSAPTFDALHHALQAPPTLVDELLAELTAEKLAATTPDVIGITAPFPGNVYGAFRIAQTIRRLRPGTPVILGGGYANTELRELAEPRVFDYFDFVTLDAGEPAFLALLEHLQGKRPASQLCKTFVRENNTVVFHHNPSIPMLPHHATGTPTYEGLPLQGYLSVFDTLNPMHRIWSDGRWNKLMVAHGCYWSQCSFCDTKLDYIERYSVAPADLLVDRMQALIRETGQTGFHFVDEAAPPAMLKKLSERLLARRVTATWWGNIRFDTYFTPEVCQQMAAAGCVAVTGGLEVAEDRLLELMKKGVSVSQVARVTRNFTQAGIMVHAYLMYGFPTQTVQETVNALELVRQLFEAGCLQSAYWHRFALTIHSPAFAQRKALGLRIGRKWKGPFAQNEIPFTDRTGVDHDMLGIGLRKALYNFMHGIGLDADVRSWFDVKVPRSTLNPAFIERALQPDPPPGC
jgi:hypothetical protein